MGTRVLELPGANLGALVSVFAELQRRRVFRALIGYGIATFALLQVVEPIMHGLHLPEVTLTYIVVALGLCFPLVVVLAWAFDIKASGGVVATAPAKEASLRGARLGLLLVGIGALAAAPGLVWYFFERGAAKQTAAARAPSIAVLPFVNLSADAANEYFSDGITEELIDGLAHVQGLHVVSRTSAFSFKGKPAEVSEIGARLKVATVLEGSVRREGTRLRLTAQLIDATNGYHLWSQSYDRELKDVFAVEGELAQSIVATLRPQLLSPTAPAKAPTENLEAHDLYLRGRNFWNRRTAEGLRKAVSLFEGGDPERPGVRASVCRTGGLVRGLRQPPLSFREDVAEGTRRRAEGAGTRRQHRRSARHAGIVARAEVRVLAMRLRTNGTRTFSR